MGQSEDHAKGPQGESASLSPLPAPASSALEEGGSLLKPRHRLLRWAFHRWFRLKRGMTLGVRAVVLDGEGRVFLVRHSYIPGWYLPGGGIEPGQSARDALVMELREEGHIELTGEPELFAFYHNRRVAPRDHVLLYVVRHFTQTRPRAPDREIAEAGFFPLHALPEKTTASTRRRLAEVAQAGPADPVW